MNLTGVYLGYRAAMRQMIAQGRGGAIINLSYTTGLVGICKGGIRLLTKFVALDVPRHDIRCNSVHPGIIMTDMTNAVASGDSERIKRFNNAMPLGRVGAPDDISATIAFLASSDAGYVTGGEFVVDSGYTAQ